MELDHTTVRPILTAMVLDQKGDVGDNIYVGGNVFNAMFYSTMAWNGTYAFTDDNRIGLELFTPKKIMLVVLSPDLDPNDIKLTT